MKKWTDYNDSISADIKSGIKSFNNLLNDNNKFIKLSDKVLQKFKLMNSYPISKKYFFEQINKVL